METAKKYLSTIKYFSYLFIFLLFPINFFASQTNQTKPSNLTPNANTQTQSIQLTSSNTNQPASNIPQTQSSQSQQNTNDQQQTKVELPEVDIALEPQAEIKILPIELPEGVTLEGLTLDIPFLGTIKLIPEKNKKTGEDLLRATLGSRKLGPIDIDDAQIIMRSGDKISIEAKTNLFGKKGTLSLQDLTRTSKLENAKEGVSQWEIGRVHLRLKFLYDKAKNIDERPVFSILPDQKVVLSAINIILERNKPINLYSNILLFGQPVKLSFNFSKTILGVNFSMKKAIKLSSLIKPLDGYAVGNLIFKDINFTTFKKISNKSAQEQASEFDNITEEPQTTFSGLVDFTSLWGGNPQEEKKEEKPEDKPVEAQQKTDGTNPQVQSANAGDQKQEAANANTQIITPAGPVNPHSQRAFNYFKSLVPSKYVTPHEQTNDGTVIATAKESDKTKEKVETESKQIKSEIEAEKLQGKLKGNETQKETKAGISTTESSTTTAQDQVTDLKAPVNNLQVNGTYNKKDGMHFEALVQNLQLPVIGNVNNTKFVFDYKSALTKSGKNRKSRAKLVLRGDGTIDIPGLGDLKYTLESEYQKGGFSIEAILNNKINFRGITLSDARLKVKPKQRILIISGHTRLHNFDLIADLEVNRETNKKQNINFNASTQIESLRPFAGTHIPIIEDFEVHDIKANVKLAKEEGQSAEISLTGKSNLLNVNNADVEVKFVHGTGVLFKAILPKDWTLSDSITALHGTLFDSIDFQKAAFIASNLTDYTDSTTNTTIKKGLSLEATTPFTGALEPIKVLLGGKLNKARIYGTLSTNPQSIVLGAQLTEQEGGLAIKTSKVSAGPMALEISGAPSLAILSTIYFHPSEKDDPLTFVGRIEIKPVEQTAVFAATMKGFWKNPFGLPNLEIGNLALQLGINIPLFSSTGLPREIGFHGEMKIGNNPLLLAAMFDLGFKDMALEGKLKYLPISDIVKFLANKMGAKIPERVIPNVELRDLEFKFASQDVKIGEFTIEQGITAKGELTIIKAKGILDCQISPSGIKAMGYTDAIHLGPLRVTASRPNDSPTGGPIIKLKMDVSTQDFLLSGKLDIEHIFTVDSYMHITTSGITFSFHTDIANGMFEAYVEGLSSGPIDNPDFKMLIDFQQKFIDYIKEKINEQLSIAQEEVKEKIRAAQERVNTINSAITKSDHDIAQAQEKVENARRSLHAIDDKIKEVNNALDKINEAKEKLRVIDDKIKEIDSAISNAKDKIENAKNELSRIDDKINAAKDKVRSAQDKIDNLSYNRECSGLPWTWHNCIAKGALMAAKVAATAGLSIAQATLSAAKAYRSIAVTGLSIAQATLNVKEIAKAALLTSKVSAEASLTAAQTTARGISIGTLTAARETASGALKGAEGFLEGVKNVSRGALIAARESANGTLEGLKQTGVATLQAGKFIAKNFIGRVNIRHARFEGSIQNIANGRLPNIMFEMSIIGQDRVLNFDFDFKDPAMSAINIARNIVDLIFGSSRKLPPLQHLVVPEVMPPAVTK